MNEAYAQPLFVRRDVHLPANRLRIAVVASHPDARNSIAALLDESGEFDVALSLDPEESHSSSRIKIAAIRSVVFDLTLSGLDFLRSVSRSHPVVALTDDSEIAREALRAGAVAVLPKTVDGNALDSAIRAVVDHLVVVDPHFAVDLLPHHEEDSEPLTQREKEVLQFLARGMTNKEIAHQLGITDHTVKFHLNSILAKLEAETRTEAVVRAARRGMVVL